MLWGDQMRSVVLASLRLSVLVLVGAGVVLSVAVAGSSHLAVETLPEFLPTHVQIQTEALGLSANEVEQFITVPLEDEFNGVPFVERLRSQSVPGLSAINLTFKPGTDIYTARQFVTERVAQGPSVVNVGTPPVMLEPLSSQARVMMIGLSSDKVALPDISTSAYWRVRPRIMAVPGVANVSIWGQRDIQLQVLFDPARANAAGVSLEQVLNTAGDATWTSPLSFLEASSPGADGLIDMPNQRLTVQHILPIRQPADLAQVPVEDTVGKTVRLGDVATIVQDHPALRGDAVLPDSPGVIMVVEKLPGADTLSVTRGIEAAMEDMRNGLPGVTVDTALFRPATYVETALKNLGIAAIIGFLLLSAWIGLSTGSWRVSLISVIAIALPVAIGVLVLQALGTTFDTMILAGLVMALGVIVDDAVVGAGMLKRNLALRDESGGGQSEAALAWDAYAEMRQPLGWALAILLLAAGPLLLVSGLAGSFLKPIVLAYALAALASTATALVVMPALANLLLLNRPSSTRRNPLRTTLRRAFGRATAYTTQRPVLAYIVIALVLVAGLVSLSQTHVGPLISPLQDRNLLVQWQAAPGTSLVEMDRITSGAGKALRSTNGVHDVASHVGQALLGDQVVSANSAETWITLDPAADYDSALAAIRRVLDSYRGVHHTLATYPEASLESAPASDGKAITVRLFGTDSQTLATEAQRIQQTLSYVAGMVVDSKIQTETTEPSVRIQTNVPAAARYGLKPGDIRRQTAVLIAGIPVGSYYHDQQIFDVTVWSDPRIRGNVASVGNLLIDTPSGGHVRLGDIAAVTIQPSPAEIDHDRVSRFIDVTADVSGNNLGQVVSTASARVGALQFPLGYHAEVVSGLQDQRSALWELGLAALGALIGIFLLMHAALQSWGRAALLFLTLPIAAVGVLPAALSTGSALTLSMLVGVVLVLGVTVRNGISLIRSFRRADSVDSVVSATKEVAAPVTITAIGIALALLPFVASGDIAGMEIMRPLGTVVMGGLVTSTLLTLVVLPVLYVQFFVRPAETTNPQAQGEVA
jgi:Cu/Ag efflux pump CusA